jgi:hypothetical protein
MPFTCAACGAELPRASFSSSQLKKQSARRCHDCLAAQPVAVRPQTGPAAKLCVMRNTLPGAANAPERLSPSTKKETDARATAASQPITTSPPAAVAEAALAASESAPPRARARGAVNNSRMFQQVLSIQRDRAEFAQASGDKRHIKRWQSTERWQAEEQARARKPAGTGAR